MLRVGNPMQLSVLPGDYCIIPSSTLTHILGSVLEGARMVISLNLSSGRKGRWARYDEHAFLAAGGVADVPWDATTYAHTADLHTSSTQACFCLAFVLYTDHEW